MVKVIWLIGYLFLLKQVKAFEEVDEMNENFTFLSNKTLSHDGRSGLCAQRDTTFKSKIFIFVLVTIFVVGLGGNMIAIAVITLSKRLRASTTNSFVAALALCDVGAILFLIPIRLDTLFHGRSFCFDEHVCQMFIFTDMWFHICSISHLFLIAIERFVAVNYPFFYQRVVSRAITWVTIASTWIYALVWAFLSLFNWERPSKFTVFIYEANGKHFCLINNRVYVSVTYIVVYIIPLAAMGVLYTSILRVALKQARVIESLSINNNQKNGGKKQRKEVRATKTLAIIYGAFTVCWLPVAIISITSRWFPDSYRRFRAENPILSEIVFSLFIEVLPTLNSCLNPFLYILLNGKFRQEIKSLYYKLRNIPPPMSMDSDSSIGHSTAISRANKYLGGSREISSRPEPMHHDFTKTPQVKLSQEETNCVDFTGKTNPAFSSSSQL